MMTRTADNSLIGHRNLQPFALALLLGALSFAALANPVSSYPAGVRNSSGPRRLNERQLQMLQDSLRQKTGFVELEFDQQGALTLGNRQNIAGGSATARALLAAAVDSANLYELESHERSPEVAFARIYESEYRLSEAGQRTAVHQVQLDFADFDCLSGAREAKASFDMGIALLHELAHGVLKLRDPRSEEIDQIGECDAHVNQIRRELRLPERLYYHPGISVARIAGKGIVHARLVFVERETANAKPSAQYSLSWFASQVAPNAQNIAGLQQGLLAARRR
jgi:hypothetical protein